MVFIVGARVLPWMMVMLAFVAGCQQVPRKVEEPAVAIKSPAVAMVDADGRTLRTGDGRVYIITAIARQESEFAKEVSRQMPERYFADRTLREVTLLNLRGSIPGAFQKITLAEVRRELDAETARLTPAYKARGVTHSPRDDLYVVADFTGETAAGLGIDPAQEPRAVVIFSPRGHPVAKWNRVPTGVELEQAIERARRL